MTVCQGGAVYGVPRHRARTDVRFGTRRARSAFLGATLVAALLAYAAPRTDRLLALSVPAAGLALWVAQSNGHGLVTVYGAVLGAVVLLVVRRRVPAPQAATRGSAGPLPGEG